MGPINAILERIGVAPAERGLFGWAALCLFLLGAAAIALMNTAETLFLKRVGVEALPLALLASSGLLVLTTGLTGRIASTDPPRALPWLLAVLALAPLPFALLLESESPLFFGAFVLVARQTLAVGALAFWLAMGSLLPARRAKTLFAPLASGITLGGILGSFGSGPIAQLIGVSGLIGLCVLLLAGSAVVGLRLKHNSVRRLDRESGAPSPVRAGTDTSFVTLFRSNQLFRLLFIALLCGGALSPVLYFEFTSVLDQATQGPGAEERLLGLYSQFRGWLNVAVLVCQLWLSANIYRRFGLPLAMTLWPVVYLAGFGWLGLDFALVAAMATFGATRVTEDGITDSASLVLYNLFPDGIRARASGLLEGPVYRLGGVLGNGFVLEVLALGGASWIGWAAMPVAGIWLVASLILWRAYPALLLRASAEHGLAGAGIDRATLLDRRTLHRLAAALVSEDTRMCRAAIDLIVDGESGQVTDLLAAAIEDAPAANRPMIVEALYRLVEPTAPGAGRSTKATNTLDRLLVRRPPLPSAERADLLRVFARLTGPESLAKAPDPASTRLLERTLGDRAAPVRLAAIAELHRRGVPPPGLPDLNRTLADALDASDALIRRAARKELRAILLTSPPDEEWLSWLHLLARHLSTRADRAETAEALREVARRHGGPSRAVAEEAIRYAEDRDVRVRGALLCMAGHAGLVNESARLVSALGSRAIEEADGAREGLVALGSDAVLPLLIGMEFGSTSQREGIVAVLRELEVDAATLESLRDRQLDALRDTALHRAAIDALPGGIASLLRRRLDERIAEGFGALLDLLSTLHEDRRIRDLERRLRRSAGGRERDLLIEAIEALLGRNESRAILQLLEPQDSISRANAVTQASGREIPDAAQAISELRESPDATIQRLASEISLEGTDTIGDPHEMPTAMDIAVHLQDMPAFERLGTQQLMVLAEQLQEQKAAAGDVVYHAGDEGLGLYFVLEGEVELRRGELALAHAGANSFFGELSMLDGVPRSADAVAQTDVRLLRLDRDDLLPLLEEVPGLAVGLARFLSSRVRRLEDRLADAVTSNEPNT